MTSYNALLVEDNETFARAVVAGFEAYKGDVAFSIEVAHSSAAAVRMIQSHDYDVIVLDLNLVDTKGDETFRVVHDAATKNITKDGKEQGIPIIVLTGRGSVDYSTMIVKGAKDFLQKPVSIERMYKRMHITILNWPYARTKELHDSIERHLALAEEAINKLPPA